MNHFKLLQRSNRGIAILLLMIILVVATAIGIWGLSSSRSSMQKAGSRKFTTTLTYQAEQGLQKAIRRIQNLAAGGTDQVASMNSDDTSTGKTGDFTQKTFSNFLLNTSGTGLCAESSCSGTANQPCTGTFFYYKSFDTINQNVDCNFLGVAAPNTQVVLVRKNNLSVTDTGETFAIFLVNSIATDTSGRKQILQGVVIVPFSGTASSGTPYLASSKTVTD